LLLGLPVYAYWAAKQKEKKDEAGEGARL